jgi:hypothetical protein
MSDRDDRDIEEIANRIANRVIVKIVAIAVAVFFVLPFLFRVAVLGHATGLIIVVAVLVGAVLVVRRSRRRG